YGDSICNIADGADRVPIYQLTNIGGTYV
ncbi:MAG: hypothetical protein K0Q48_3352, partial [Bacillota bacterium]|nr:hypothetical protein [Bacillota bacterium]